MPLCAQITVSSSKAVVLVPIRLPGFLSDILLGSRDRPIPQACDMGFPYLGHVCSLLCRIWEVSFCDQNR